MPSDVYQGASDPADTGSEFNAMDFVARQVVSGAWTATPVKVVLVNNTGSLAAAGYVDVLPLINQTDGQGNATPHTTVHNIPYFRLRAGSGAVIIDPAVGDFGFMVCASHDASTVLATQAQGNPGSWRRFSASDGFYFGGFLGGVPSSYVQFLANGGINIVGTADITVSTTTQINLNAPTTIINGNLGVNGSITSTGSITGDGIVLNTHTHSGVSTGSGDTGPPV